MGRITKKDKLLLQEFAAEFRSCAVCWWPESDMRRRMEIHHIVQGAGRVHDRRCLLSLCSNCHTVHHSGSKVTGLPDITKGVLLGCKQETDPDNYAPQYLASLKRKKHLGYEPEPLPEAYERQRERNAKGWMYRTP